MTSPVSHCTAFALGRNVDGCLGLGDAVANGEFISNPTQLNVDTIAWAQIACGPYHTVALSRNGEVFTWGRDDLGQLGHGDWIHRNVPMKVESLCGETIVKVACGSRHTAALTAGGKLFTWYVQYDATLS